MPCKAKTCNTGTETSMPLLLFLSGGGLQSATEVVVNKSASRRGLASFDAPPHDHLHRPFEHCL